MLNRFVSIIHDGAIVLIGGDARCMVTTDSALSFGTEATERHIKLLDGRWMTSRGVKSQYAYYPVGCGDPA